MKPKGCIWLVVALVLVLLLAGCDRSGGEETETSAAEPVSSQLAFTVPYRAVLNEGDTVAGAQLQYLGNSEDGIHVRIGGEDAYKKVGDSFNWHASPAAGVELDYKLRVMGVYLGVFQAWGDVDITISETAPVVMDLPDSAPWVFSPAVATYAVTREESVPGTTYSYLGKSDKGAQFGGVEGYAYREIADSLEWSGRVRSNVYLDLTMRVSFIGEEETRLIGTATIWIFP